MLRYMNAAFSHPKEYRWGISGDRDAQCSAHQFSTFGSLTEAGNAGEESEWQVFCAACIYFPHGKCDLSYGKCGIYSQNPQSREEQRTEEQRTVEDSRAEQTREEKAVTADSGLTTELEEKLNCKFDHNFCLELRRLQNKGMQREASAISPDKHGRLRMHRAIRQGISARCCRTASVTASSPRKGYAETGKARTGAQPAIGPSSEQLSAFDREWYERVQAVHKEGRRRCRHNPFQPRPCLL